MALIEFKGAPIEKLITVMSEAIGTLYRPTRIKKEAEAEAYRIEKIHEAEAKGLIIKFDAESTLAERASRFSAVRAIEQQANLENITARSIDHLPPVVSDQPVDKDWASRFIDYAKNVQNSDMQELWAKILSGEISNPGSISLRTLSVLSNLSQSEATIFTKIIKYTIDTGAFFYPKPERTDHIGISYDDILRMRTAGLIVAGDNIEYHPNPNEVESGIRITMGETYWDIKISNIEDLRIPTYSFTDEGIQLMTLTDDARDFEYVNNLLNKYISNDGIVNMGKLVS